MSELLIGKLSELSGVHPQTIRYYERIGLLLAPRRTAAGYRRFDEKTVDELKLIRRAQALGFSLDEIRRMLRTLRRNPASCTPVMALARAHLDRIERAIEELRTVRARVAEAIDRCGLDSCTLTLEALTEQVLGPPSAGRVRPRRFDRSLIRYGRSPGMSGSGSDRGGPGG